jgi:hypothetical protein
VDAATSELGNALARVWIEDASEPSLAHRASSVVLVEVDVSGGMDTLVVEYQGARGAGVGACPAGISSTANHGLVVEMTPSGRAGWVGDRG